ncbi:MAG: redoxin domain-containing protein [Phycisphaeraceae bacterium]|nr:redoxin domain-containing protein [Phycisphaeraceae bacterium]
MSDQPIREKTIGVGEIAPDFTLKDQNRNDWNLAEHVKQGDVVLCFYPLAFTSVCSTEMKCVSDEIAKWSAQGAQVVGVSCDSFAVLAEWAKQLGLKQTLLADMHRNVCTQYGLFWKDLNVSQRGTVVIAQSADGKGTVKWTQSREPGKAMNFEDVLASLSK